MIGIHNDKQDPLNDGIIIQDNDGQVKHIKAKRLEEEPTSFTELSEVFSEDNNKKYEDLWEDYSEMTQFEFAEEMNEQENNLKLNNNHLNEMFYDDYGIGGNMILKAYKDTQENYPGNDEVIILESPSNYKDLEDARNVIDKGGVNGFTLADQGYMQEDIVKY